MCIVLHITDINVYETEKKVTEITYMCMCFLQMFCQTKALIVGFVRKILAYLCGNLIIF